MLMEDNTCKFIFMHIVLDYDICMIGIVHDQLLHQKRVEWYQESKGKLS